jgi:stage II sporulation protein GA (sporulation sigma-E factor processing peptidase)
MCCGDLMIIYLDVLIVTNIILDYFLLNVTSLIVRRSINLKRIIVSSLFGGISSLYIFADIEFIVADILYNVIIGFIMVFIVTGFNRVRELLFSFCIFIFMSFILSGFFDMIYRYTTSDVFLSDKFICYMDVSPIFLIGATAMIYLVFCLLKRVSDKKRFATSVELKIEVCGHSEKFLGLVDTGHNVTDPFGTSPVFIVDESKCSAFRCDLSQEERSKRKRLIPIKTVSGRLILDALRCDKAEITENSKVYFFENPIIAFAPEVIDNGYNAIVPAMCFDRQPDRK